MLNLIRICLLGCLLVSSAKKSGAQGISISSPDKKLIVTLSIDTGRLQYEVWLQGKQMLKKSPLGIKGSQFDLSRKLILTEERRRLVDETYNEKKIKKSNVKYIANELTCLLENSQKNKLKVIFQVSNNNIAFRYFVPQTTETANLIVEKELSGYNFPLGTTTFLTSQATPMIGWMKTKPSYEEEYVADQAMGEPSKYGVGYTFPALFRIGDKGWVLLSETGVNGSYCGSKLSEGTRDGAYKIAFPEAGENNGMGRPNPTMALPGYTPWRTITVGENLNPIVETTIPFDVVKPMYEPSKDYTFGRSTWSWLLWQDGSINFEDQKKFIDLSSKMGYEFVLIDNWWDTGIGREKIELLVNYGRERNVNVMLWYNSNGFWNDAPQGPKNKMDNAIVRRDEMAWMKRIGVKGIKVDFFGGDKQETLKLYEEILSDANIYGITVIFHGCTLPRGWERMYPNFVGSEAVLASENLIFFQHANDTEAFNASLHPFIRNSVASMDFGPVLLNKKHNKDNNGGTIRRTTETFQIATSILFQTPIQNFGITPNNLTDVPGYLIEFMKSVPTTWDETLLIDGYPGKFCVLARRKENNWYIAAINSEKTKKTLSISLPMIRERNITIYSDDEARKPQINKISMKNAKPLKLDLLPGGGAVIIGK